jgi:hypothetical protein
MRIEIFIFIVTALLMANLYTDGKYLKMVFKFKKYYQMIGIAIGGLIFYYLIKKNPLSMGSMLTTTNDYLKYMPIDKNTASIISPILDFTSKQNFYQDQYESGGYQTPVLPVQHIHLSNSERKIMMSGTGNNLGTQGNQGNQGKVKRSVSETKKKFVASRQGWKCGDCQDQLNAWFEVDHKIRLEHGGSNHVDNLVALCRDCHGKKTTIENL